MVAFELGQGGEDVKTSLPPGVVVSMASCKLRNPIPRSANPSDGVDQVPNDRPSRSRFHPTRVSPGRSWSRTCSRVGRSARAPLAIGEVGPEFPAPLGRGGKLRDQLEQAGLGRLGRGGAGKRMLTVSLRPRSAARSRQVFSK